VTILAPQGPITKAVCDLVIGDRRSICENNMEPLTAFFSHVCGQGRCFTMDGLALPVCQRCTGLYIGALLTGLWLLIDQIWRRGLPERSVVCMQAGALILAMLGGIHVLDIGPGWRLLCGLWTGHVAVVWLVTGASQLEAWFRRSPAGALSWSRRQTLMALIAMAIMPMLAIVLAAVPQTGWWLWTGAIVGGAAALAAVTMRLLLLLTAMAFVAPRPGRKLLGC
jgi:hypothetical protein